ncbi:MAG: hypothetical protein U0271_22640 [Polyangiaceae bacterium]
MTRRLIGPLTRLGIPIGSVLAVLAEEDPRFRPGADALAIGTTVLAAVFACPGVFDVTWTETIRRGEETGTLESCLVDLGQYDRALGFAARTDEEHQRLALLASLWVLLRNDVLLSTALETALLSAGVERTAAREAYDMLSNGRSFAGTLTAFFQLGPSLERLIASAWLLGRDGFVQALGCLLADWVPEFEPTD